MVECPAQTCEETIQFLDYCWKFTNDGTENCSVPCFTAGCEKELIEGVECPIWTCHDHPTNPTTTASPSTTPSPTPAPWHSGMCEDPICYSSLGANGFFLIALIILIVIIVRNRFNQRRLAAWLFASETSTRDSTLDGQRDQGSTGDAQNPDQGQRRGQGQRRDQGQGRSGQQPQCQNCSPSRQAECLTCGTLIQTQDATNDQHQRVGSHRQRAQDVGSHGARPKTTNGQRDVRVPIALDGNVLASSDEDQGFTNPLQGGRSRASGVNLFEKVSLDNLKPEDIV